MRILKRLRKESSVDGRSIVRKEKEYFVRDENADFHSDSGIISKEDLAKPDGTLFTSNKGMEFVAFTPKFIDLYRKISRAAQVIPLKDVGSIITKTGISEDSRVVDAGAGSGALALMLAHFAGEVTTYDIREDHLERVRQNAEYLGIKLSIKNGNLYEGVEEKDLDCMTLDLPEPWEALNTIRQSLKVGGFVVVYNPSIVQITDFVNSLEPWLEVQTIVEINEREWEIKGRKVRPKRPQIYHSGFLCFARRVMR
ncbi:MAG: tRNA (adenine-N1)-methyltransferase [Candidatus Woesearchaeota archaeon]